MKLISPKFLLFGLLAAYAAAYLVEIATYKLVFIPSIQSSFVELNKSMLNNEIDYGEGKLAILAPLAFRDDCSKTYYGCFSWDNFPGAELVVAFQGGSQQKVAIVTERVCTNEKCVSFDGFSARGYFVDNIEYSEISRNFDTEILCNNFVHDYIVPYKVKLCTNITTGYGNIVAEKRYARIQGLLLSRFLYSVDYSIFFQVIANYGTQQVYLREGW